MQLNRVVLTKLDKNNESKHFIYIYTLYNVILLHQILMNMFNIINCNSIIIYTKIIGISIKPCFFILSGDQSFEMFPRHNGVATISESFALNL